MTQQELAVAAGISKLYLSQIESGKRTGTAEVLAAIAEALSPALNDICVTGIGSGQFGYHKRPFLNEMVTWRVWLLHLG